MKKVLVIILLFMVSNIVLAQTAYEQKCFDIFNKYAKTLYGSNLSNSDYTLTYNTYVSKIESGLSPQQAAEESFTLAALVYNSRTGKNAELIFKQMATEYKAAEKLMTADEKLYFKILEESRVPYGKVKWAIVKEFNIWMNKGEYENTNEWETRLKEQSRSKFDDIAFKAINNVMYSNYWLLKFGRYDADNKDLEVIFYDKDESCTISHFVKASPETARLLKTKSDIQNGDINVYSDGFTAEDNIVFFEYDTDELCVIDKKVFVPRYFHFTSGNDDLVIDLTNIDGINYVKYPVDEVPISNQYIKGYVFDASEYAKFYQELKAKRRAAQEAADLATIEKYNKDIDDAFAEANRKLAANKYNIYGISMENGWSKLTKNDEKEYKTRLSKIQEAYQQYEDEIKIKYNYAYSDFRKYYKSNEEFDKFYCQGLNVFNTESEFRTVQVELEKNKSSIAAVNFQKEMNNNSLMNVISEQPTDYTKVNDYRKRLLAWVNDMKNKPYYEQVVDFMINNNVQMQKEYLKNGSKFSSKTEFYEAFTSGDYKNVLKTKK